MKSEAIDSNQSCFQPRRSNLKVILLTQISITEFTNRFCSPLQHPGSMFQQHFQTRRTMISEKPGRSSDESNGGEGTVVARDFFSKFGPTHVTPGIPTTIKTMGVNITTIAFLRVLIIEIGPTIILMVVEAQGHLFKRNILFQGMVFQRFFILTPGYLGK